MKRFYIFLFFFLVGPACPASKYYDGPIRPYEFGYSIDKNQHRFEKKDENGIIMGEFGFVTADGIYHITAYATDENGSFKILFMKNIRVDLFKMDSSSKTPSTTKNPITTTLPTISKVFEPPLLEKPLKEDTVQQTTPAPYSLPKQKNAQNNQPRTYTSKVTSTRTTTTTPMKKSRKFIAPGSEDYDIDVRFINDEDRSGPGSEQKNFRGNSPVSNKKQTARSDPRKISKEIRMKAKDLSRKRLSENDMQELGGLLYRFNYTLKYNGHNENGYLSGNKDGKYFILGKDGIKRLIEYMANEIGFQPHIKLEDLKEEPSDENRLLGYEFVWLKE